MRMHSVSLLRLFTVWGRVLWWCKSCKWTVDYNVPCRQMNTGHTWRSSLYGSQTIQRRKTKTETFFKVALFLVNSQSSEMHFVDCAWKSAYVQPNQSGVSWNICRDGNVCSDLIQAVKHRSQSKDLRLWRCKWIWVWSILFFDTAALTYRNSSFCSEYAVLFLVFFVCSFVFTCSTAASSSAYA